MEVSSFAHRKTALLLQAAYCDYQIGAFENFHQPVKDILIVLRPGPKIFFQYELRFANCLNGQLVITHPSYPSKNGAQKKQNNKSNGASKENEREIKSDFGEYPRFFKLSHQILFQALERFCQRRARPRRRNRMNVRYWHFGHGEVRVESVMRSKADVDLSSDHAVATKSFLIHTPSNNHQSIIRQRPLQRLGFIPWRTHPYVAFLVSRQDHRHGLGMNRFNNGVRCGGRGNGFESLNRYRGTVSAVLPKL
jgi:hypothetical protein